MQISTLKAALSQAQGGPFALSSSEVGVQSISDLLASYLQGSLSLSRARGDPTKLTLDGQLTLGGASRTTHVDFVAGGTGADLAGIVITLQLSTFALTSPALTFSVPAVANYLSSPELILSAGGVDSTMAPSAVVAGTPNVTLPPDATWQLTALARTGTDPMETSFAFAGPAPPGLSVASLLAKVLDTDPAPQLTLAPGLGAPTVTAMAVVVDPASNVLGSTRFDLQAPITVGLSKPLPMIDAVTISLLEFPGGTDSPLFVTLGAKLTVYSGVDLDLSLRLPDLLMEAELDQDTPIQLRDVAKELTVPPAVCAAIPDVEISELRFAVSLDEPTSWGFQMVLEDDQPFVLAGVTLKLETLMVLVEAAGGNVDLSVTAGLDVGAARLFLTLSHDTEWHFEGGTDGYQEIALTPLLADLAGTFGLTGASLALPSLVLHRVDAAYSTDGTLHFDCSGSLTVSTVTLSASVTVDRTNAGQDVEFGGDLTITTKAGTTLEFKLEVHSAPTQTQLVGTLVSEGALPTLDDLLGSLGLGTPIPHGLDVVLKGLGALYQSRTNVDSALLLTVDTNYGDALFALQEPNTGAARYLFAIAPNLSGSLSEIPLIGKAVPPALDLALKSAQVVITPGGMPDTVIAELNALFAALEAQLKGTWQLDPKAGTATAELDMVLQLGDTTKPVRLAMGPGPDPPPSPSPGPVATADVVRLTAQTLAPSRPGHWLPVQKSLGPLFVRQVGLDYAGGDLEVLLDADLTFGPLAISLSGLSLSTPVNGFHPVFGLEGAGVSLQTTALTIDGAFHSLTPNGLKDPDWEYGGELVIGTPAFTISGVAAYGQLKGHPSFFAFAMLSAELGGPPFFYVTGLAGGFGYNRSLAIPTLDTLPSFPLIAAATATAGGGGNPFAGKTDPTAALTVLDEYLPETIGESWFAVGVRFTSFELIDSFALLTVQFGTDLEIALLGLSRVTVPTGASEPIAYAELALEVTFSEREGKLAIAAQLTPASYVMSTSCHLTGGFAFYSWLKDNTDGAPAGDFVVTLGGYNPAYSKPGWYPSVPGVGANWQVTSNLVIKGNLYFALTPSSVMAGGALEATWQSGNLKAWFDAHADFLLSWKPFHYSVSIGVSLGASYVLDLWFCSCTFTVSLGVDVTLGGPPFGGSANVHLYVVSFTISFGHQPGQVQATPWTEFAGSLGPIASLQIADGLVTDLTNDKQHDTDPDWVVAPGAFRLTTQSAVPCTASALVSGNAATTTLSNQLPGSFGVGPVGVVDGDLESTHTITIHKLTNDGTPDTSTDLRSNVACNPVARNLPRAPWSKALSLDLVRNPHIATVNNVPATIHGLVTGYDITPAPLSLTTLPSPIDVKSLGGSPAPDRSFAWSSITAPTVDTFDQSTVAADLHAIDGTTVHQTRATIVAALQAEGVHVSSAIDVAPIAADPGHVVRGYPLLSLLGEEKVAA